MTLPLAASRCGGTTRAGRPCGAHPARGRQFCTLHDPKRAPAVHAAGGRARSRRAVLTSEEAEHIRLANVSDAPASLERVARWAATGALDVRIANCIGVLASASVRAADAAELEKRLTQLERAIGARR